MADVELRVNGMAYTGWTSARVTRGIESVAGGFELTVSDRGGGQASWPIYEGDECTVILGGEVVITGYVDRRSPSYGPGEHSLSVSGRDRTGDLVDCSALPAKWEYLNTPAVTVARAVAQPFGVAVTVQPGLTMPAPAPKLTIDPGDTAFDVIERACRAAGVLAVSDGRGGLTLMRPGSTRTTTELVEGQNILSASADFDQSSRFRRYVVLGQHAGSDDWFGESAARIRAEATDAGVKRTARTLVVRPEGNMSVALAKRRAEWEATVRAARGDAVTVTVQGWTQGNGKPWPVNALAVVRSPRIGINGALLVSQVEFSASESGTTTRLTLRRPDAFKPEPTVQGGDGGWKEIREGV